MARVLTIAGAPATGFGADASLMQPYGLALDASGNAWLSNFSGDTITQFLGIATPIETPFAGPPVVPQSRKPP